MKYLDCHVVFKEHPKHVSLMYRITNCPKRCIDCHSPELQQDIGEELTTQQLCKDILKYHGMITNVMFFGGEQYEDEMTMMLDICHSYQLKTTLWTGSCQVTQKILERLDYVKIGNYDPKFGDLSNPNTNQRYFNTKTGEDIRIC